MASKKRHTETYKGVRIYIRYNTSAELHDKLKQRKLKIDRQTMDGKTLLKDFADRYIETYKAPKVSEKWLEGLKLISNRHIVGVLGNRPISDIKPLEVQEMLNSRDVSNNYITKIYNLTCQIFHYAYKNGLTATDYSEDLEKPKGRKAEEGKRLTEKEQESMLKVIKGHRAETLCSVMYYCGLRTAEARNLKWMDVDLKKKLIHIHGTKTRNANRVVPIPDALMPVLEGNHNPTDYVCLHEKQQAEKAWRNIKRLMNIDMGCKIYRNKIYMEDGKPFPVQEGLRLYDLRHTYCTNLELQGVPISIASRLMGHSNISITAKFYTHGTDESVEIARNLINSVPNGVPKSS